MRQTHAVDIGSEGGSHVPPKKTAIFMFCLRKNVFGKLYAFQKLNVTNAMVFKRRKTAKKSLVCNVNERGKTKVMNLTE